MLYIASDHAGFQLKNYITNFLKNQTSSVFKDLGPKVFKEDDDYPDFAFALTKEVAKNKIHKGILICGSGHGMCIAANKTKGIRAIEGYNIQGTEMGRRHNDANVLCLAGRILSNEHAAAIARIFLETEFAKDHRFMRRNKKIADYEK
ncbi:MAG: RpiB/LacA/LacB family sugar-phosphate isomerase [Patescibacteria group bacterium]|nr:RpiB/LacA/LacB family sugar-phosphate isomerase [Patescibacteria group bacterium]